MNTDLIYGIDDRPPLKETLFAAIQHLLAIFVAIIGKNGKALSSAMAGESFFVRGDYPENEDLKKRFLSGFHGEDFDSSPIFGDDDFGFRGPSGIR